ncbi:hypothetical protein ACC686_36355, partial [Rhizobium johnstonii]|uniref:hypothetical protein n=1 Tax=Rhizobium johnstonii TaxID=3019933 RepID=UPI003F99E31B
DGDLKSCSLDPADEPVAADLLRIGSRQPDQPAVGIPADLAERPDPSEQTRRIDRIGNIFGIWKTEGTVDAAPLMLGSHIDTVI